MKKLLFNKWIFVFLTLYFIINLLFLEQFPFMHSDESWLSGLTREMMQNGLSSTEPFFDLYPRYPHAVKLLFHLLQMAFIHVFGYGLFAVRLISLIFGTAMLYLFYLIALRLTDSKKYALIAAAVLSLDVQFLYSSHFARQDIIIAFGITAVIYFMMRFVDQWSFKYDLIAGAAAGLSIGVHPNSLMIALCLGAVYLFYLFEKKLSLKNLTAVILTVACFAGIFIGISYLFDRDFLRHYMAYGSTLGVDLSFTDKLKAFPLYWLKLWSGVTGTYYIPPLKLSLALFGIGVAASFVYAFFNRRILLLLLPVAAVCAGFILIGRYSQPSVVLLFPLCYLLIFFLADRLFKNRKFLPALLLGIAAAVNTVFAVVPFINNDYQVYLNKIAAAVPSNSNVLANLNAEYAFDNGALRDYRNLEFLDDEGVTFEEYLSRNDIEYIIYPEEMDYIYEKRPVWNILYGNVHPYYADMKKYLEDSCAMVGAFQSPYAMRIAPLMYTKDWQVRIYRVEKEQP